MKIESRKNTKISFIKKLQKNKKFRDHDPGQLIWIEGIHLLEEALSSRCCFKECFVSESKSQNDPEIVSLLTQLVQANVPIQYLKDDLADYLLEVQSPQGIGALIHRPSIASSDPGNILVLNNIQDPGNVGTLIRSAEAAGFSEVFLTPGSADPWGGKSIRATMGSIFRVSVKTDVSLLLLKEKKTLGYVAIGAELENSISYQKDQSQKSQKILLFLGSEGDGLSDEIREILDFSVHIPMHGSVDSLNVAIAGSILMFHYFENDC